MADRRYWKGFAANLGLMLVGFAVTIALILIVASSGLPHGAAEVLAGVALLPMFGAMSVAHYRIFRSARRRPSAVRWRRLPVGQRLVPVLLFAGGVGLAKLLKAEAAPGAYVHASAWAGLVLAIVVTVMLRRKSEQL
jgi:hypothetical protein